ncbi:MAG TPA: hypothetical protein VK524_27115 [Polyangiaceae bacterium]|nr:hypothetical protein [Polyangiaceae bacterium]
MRALLRFFASVFLASIFALSARPAAAQYGSPPPPGYGQPGYQGGYQGGYYQEPPPPPQKPDEGFEIPDFSVRIDPLNWLLEGRLGFELEVQLWEFITFETIPVFVVDESPLTLRLGGREDNLTQHSNGLGALSGATLGVGFWLDGEPFEGYVLRAVFTNYGYEYRTEDDGQRIDSVEHTERHLYGFFGSYRRWGFFTIGGGIGIGVELNKQERCLATGTPIRASSSGCEGEMQIALNNQGSEGVDLNGPLHPVQINFRFSLGAAF